jgi:hypothetical protein
MVYYYILTNQNPKIEDDGQQHVKRTKDKQRSTKIVPKSDLSVLENLSSHNSELSVLSVLDLA